MLEGDSCVLVNVIGLLEVGGQEVEVGKQASRRRRILMSVAKILARYAS